MRRLSTCILLLALGLQAARVKADEIEWRAAAPAQLEAVSLQRPQPTDSTTSSGETIRLVRFQRSEAAQPMPTGPALGGEEILGPPRPLITGPTTSAPPMDPDIISRWVGESPFIAKNGPVFGPVSMGGNDCSCGVTCCDPCAVTCCDPCATCCDPCGPVCCDCCPCCNDCRDRPLFWLRGEYLLWAFKQQNVPPLVTGNPLGIPPVLGFPGTVVLYGANGSDLKDFSGGRFTAGFWCPHCSDFGLEGSYFFLGKLSKTFDLGSSGGASLGRPINVVNSDSGLGPPGENVELVALAPGVSGNVLVSTTSQLWGAEANFRYKWLCGPAWHCDFLAGFRYVDLQESINISENLSTIGFAGAPAGAATGIVVSDRFGTHDQFYGGQIGWDTEVHWRRFFMAGNFKIAMGDMFEQVRIGGNTTFTLPGASPITQNGGVLALASNIGTFSRNRFAVVPEAGLKIGIDICENLRIFAGYNFLYLSDVVRPGDQIDRRINTNQLPTVFQGTHFVQPALPTVLFKPTDFWAQGLTAGLEFRY